MQTSISWLIGWRDRRKNSREDLTGTGQVFFRTVMLLYRVAGGSLFVKHVVAYVCF